MKRQSAAKRPATTLYDHIRELQFRLFACAAALIVAGLGVYLFYEPILELLRAPLGAPLYYNSPAGSFAFVMRICLMGGLTIAIPAIVYNLIMFIQPAYGQTMKRRSIIITSALSSLFAIAGATFAYTFILPGSLHFFEGFQVSGLSALISADNYLGFVTNIIITFVLVFQIPLLIVFIDTVKPLPPKQMLKMEKWVILGSLIIALVVPFTYDIATSMLIALPIIILYNLSLAVVVIRHFRAKHRTRYSVARSSVNYPYATEIALTTSTLASFADELSSLKKATSRPAKVAAKQPALRPLKAHVIDQKPTTIAAKLQPRTVRPTAKAMSDFGRSQRRSRVVA